VLHKALSLSVDICRLACPWTTSSRSRPSCRTLGDLAAAREGGSNVLGDREPASTLIVSSFLALKLKFEVEGIAVA